MNELQGTLEEIMEIFKCQDHILEDQQYQQELLEKLNAENRKLSAENRNLIIQNQRLVTQNRQLQELCKD